MEPISLTLNQLGQIKSIILHERLIKKVTHLYCFVENNSKFLDLDELIKYLTLNKIENDFLLREIINLCGTINYLFNDIIELDKVERKNDISLESDFICEYKYGVVLDFHIFRVDSNYVENHFSNSYKDVILNEETHHFLYLESIALLCKKISNALEILFPELSKNVLTKVFRDDYAIYNPDNYLYNHLEMFIEFQNLNLENLEFLIPVEAFDDNINQIHTIKNKELHNHIFKNDAIVKFESCLDSFVITDKSRTDMKFIFEQMKKDSLIHSTVKQADFLLWLSKTYDLHIEKTNNHNPTKKRLRLYSKS
ncbi:hypothetical protein [Psychroserpens sp. S379A]|uniref:hypothetical protein n=1 Tax=Psychroserpens sp. S379A TaxID=3415137 RepID=UPI003C7B802C